MKTLSHLRLCLWMIVVALGGCGRSVVENSDVLEIAYGFDDGGGYRWEDTGAPERVMFRGIELVARCPEWTYCNGYTFVVVMQAAAARGLLDAKYVDDMWRFKREWYASVPGSAEKGTTLAMVNLGIGKEVSPGMAEPGDFIYWQAPSVRSAHSAIFLGWIEEEDVIVGFEYRGSQPRTDGIGDHHAYFTTIGNGRGTVPPDRFYVARLNPPE